MENQITKATYIKKSTIEMPDVWTHFGLAKDKGDRWYPSENTPNWVAEYLEGHRIPSRRWPNSYLKALLTQKFAKLVVENDPALAIELGIAE